MMQKIQAAERWLLIRLGDARYTLHLARLALLQSHAEMHPARAPIHAQRSIGEWLADGMASAVGSWPFVIGQTIFISAWIIWNSLSGRAFDPFPWILLNLCMSTQAMYTGPVILLSSNRQAARDRARDDVEAREVDELTDINRRQLKILEQQNVILEQQNVILDVLQHGAPGQRDGQAVGAPQSSQQASQVPHNALSGLTVPRAPQSSPSAPPFRRKDVSGASKARKR